MIYRLGVFTDIYGASAEMTIGRALLISVVGFMIVFLILGLIALFVKTVGAVFDGLRARNDAKAPQALSVPASMQPLTEAQKLPEGASQGTLVLEDVSEEEAAVVMAVTAHKTGIPLNRLLFHSIKRIKETDDK
ncbi:MAG: OadG family protein [Clostridia bacterium]|nr:OadG family protein [Clostridia bacterium]